MANYSAISYGGITLHVTSVSPTKKEKTRKYAIGKTLVQTKIIGLDAQQWELRISGTITGTTQANLGTNRAALETLDDVAKHNFTDGIHNGDFIINPGSLNFQDEEDNAGTHYRYQMSLIEW